MTPEQLEIIQSDPSVHSRVLASAGSGKTRTMVIRCIYLLNTLPILPSELLVLTYNSDAAKEFESRLKSQVKKYNYGMPTVNTFHAFSLRVLNKIESGEYKTKHRLPKLNLSAHKYLQESLAKKALKFALDRDKKSKKVVSNDLIDDFLNFISLVKSDILPVEQKFSDENYAKSDSFLISAFKAFEKERLSKKIRFFDDLILDLASLMLSDTKLKEQISKEYKQIIVDEYQDVNSAQQKILECLTYSGAKIMVVGDADQCIYEWRGARPEYIVSKFMDIYPEASTYELSYTFRNGHAVSIAANSLIRNNKERAPHSTLSYETAPQTSIRMHQGDSEEIIGAVIDNWIQKGNSYDGVAILTRLYAMASPIEFELINKNIPYKIDGNGKSIFEQPIFKGFKALIELSKNELSTLDENIYEKIYSILTLSTLRMKKETRHSLISQISKEPKNILPILKSFKEYSFGYVMHELDMRIRLIEYIKKTPTASASDIITKAIKILEMFEQIKNNIIDSKSAENKRLIISGVLKMALDIDSQNKCFLSTINQLDSSRLKNKKSKNSVLITTIHKAKGAEWPMVVLPSLEEGLFPYYKESSPPFEVESERRLFYVAMTRAQKELNIICPKDNDFKKAFDIGDTAISKIKKGGASRFLYESNFKKALEISEVIYSNNLKNNFYTNDASAINDYIKNLGLDIKISGDIFEYIPNLEVEGFKIGDKVVVEGLNETGSIVKLEKDEDGSISVIHVDVDGRIWPLNSKKIGLMSV